MEDKKITAVGETEAAEKNMNISSDNIIARAIEKINTCGKFKDRYASVIAEPVKRALQEFCRQEEEFARAVIDGGSAEDCINNVAKDISKKQAVSDPEVFHTAAKYYFPGAVIEYKMIIHMSEYELEKAEQTEVKAEQTEAKAEQTEQSSARMRQTALDLSLDSLLDW